MHKHIHTYIHINIQIRVCFAVFNKSKSASNTNYVKSVLSPRLQPEIDLRSGDTVVFRPGSRHEPRENVIWKQLLGQCQDLGVGSVEFLGFNCQCE